MEDNYRHKGLRKKLVEEIREMGLEDPKVLDAINAVPRHAFMDTAFLNFAYTNKAFPIGAGQTISQPYTVAVQTWLLDIQAGMKILEVGTGSGYQTAVLCEMGAKVYSIERQKPLFSKAKQLLKKLGYEAYLTYGDGYKGLTGYAPYDGIVVTCGAPTLPETLLNQLKIGGKIVIPVDENGDLQRMKRYLKKAENQIVEEDYGAFKFVPMLQNRSDG
ncbi:MAG: protein-L-isoaspartate(D-aspartate) O-methyltransferase [Luteibaculum sp.]